MSAAGRGPRGGQGRDFYATPSWCTRAIVRALGDSVNRSAWWLEPACGDGAIEKVLSEEFGISKVIATDIAPGPRYAGQFDYVHRLDYTNTEHRVLGVSFEVAITNPPYSLAFEFVARMVLDARVAVALLPLSFLGSRKRKSWLQAHPPNLFVLSERPSFAVSVKCKECGYSEQSAPEAAALTHCGCGARMSRTTTDASEYAWFVFGLPAQPIQFLSKEGNT